MDKRLQNEVAVVKDGKQEMVPNKTLVQWNNWWKGWYFTLLRNVVCEPISNKTNSKVTIKGRGIVRWKAI